MSGTFWAGVNEVYPFPNPTLARCNRKLARLKYRSMKIKVTGMQTQKLYHFGGNQSILEAAFQGSIALFWSSGRLSFADARYGGLARSQGLFHSPPDAESQSDAWPLERHQENQIGVPNETVSLGLGGG